MNLIEQNAPIARANLLAIQKSCESLPDENRMTESPPLKHWHMNGVYMREILLPKDSLVVGKIHRFDHLSIISKGKVTVYTENGLEDIEAPATFFSKAGTKRAVYAHEETIWTTIHSNPDDELDVTILENRYTTTEYSELGLDVADVPQIKEFL